MLGVLHMWGCYTANNTVLVAPAMNRMQILALRGPAGRPVGLYCGHVEQCMFMLCMKLTGARKRKNLAKSRLQD